MSTKIGEEADPSAVEYLIEEAMSAKAHQLEAQVATSAERVSEAERARERAEAERVAADQTRRQVEAERDQASAEAERRARDLKTAEDAHRAESGALRTEIKAVHQRLDDSEREAAAARARSRRRRGNGAALVGAALVDAGGATLLATGTASGTWPVIVVIAVMAVVIYAAVRMLSENLAKELVAVIGIVSLVVTVVSLLIAQSS